MQLLSECFVLAAAGSVLGLAIAGAAAAVLRNMAKALPRATEISLDWRMVVYTLFCAVVATLLCGLFPALRGTRQAIAGELAHTGRAQVSTRNPFQWLLVGVQVSLAVALLAGAGLLLRSFQELGRVPLGFVPEHVLAFRISGNWGETTDRKKLTQRIDYTLDALRALPGVVSAATASVLPGLPNDIRTDFDFPDRQVDGERKLVGESRFVSQGYFTSLRMPLLDGKDCDRAAPNSVLINRSFVNSYFPGRQPIGHHLEMLSKQFPIPVQTISGIAADAREQGASREPAPTVYWCVSAPVPSPYFIVQTRTDPMSMAAAIRSEMRKIEPSRSVFDIAPLSDRLTDSVSENRFRTLLLSVFALTAILLAAVGLFGTLNYLVTVRRREVGLRLALGARPAQIIQRFLLSGLGVSALGAVIGLCIAAACGRWISGMLYGVSSVDPATYGAVIVMVLGVAVIASLIPSLRASRVDPMLVLRDQ